MSLWVAKFHKKTIFISFVLIFSLSFVACGGASTTKPAATTTVLSLGNTQPVTGTSIPTATGSLTSTSAAAPSSSASPSPAVQSTATPAAGSPASFSWKQVTDGLDKPDGIFNAGDGSGRLFVLEQPGTIRIIKNGQLLPDAFLDIRDRVGSQGSEQGLLGIAFDPDFSKNGYFYLDYTNKDGNTVISLFKVSSNPDQADAAGELIILGIDQPYPNHNGGQLAFGPDGFLYIGMGDGGNQGDPHGNGQSVQTLLGKILRIDVSQSSQSAPYTIPENNPFAKGGGRPEIWAYGLRNPWRFYFDPLTQALLIADVGQDTWEEIDYIQPGYNGPALDFGWNCREGMHPYKDCSAPAGSSFTDPVWEYNHADGGCSIIGGLVYHGKELPGMDGIYLFGDYCSGKIWGLTNSNGQNWNAALLYQTNFLITAFGVDEAGEAYVVDQHGGIYRLTR